MRLAHSSRGVPIRYGKTPDVVAYFLVKLQYYVNSHCAAATKPTRNLGWDYQGKGTYGLQRMAHRR